jgi:hypothetical protein
VIGKDLYSALTKHWMILILPVIALIIINSLGGQSEMKPTIALFGDFDCGKTNELSVQRVNSYEEGKHLVERGVVDAFVFIENDKITVLRNGRSMSSYYVRPIIEKMTNPPTVKIEYVGNEAVADISSVSMLFAFVCFGLPSLLFQDDKDTIKALIFSPVKNRTILLSKVGTSAFMFSLLGIFYLFFIDAMKLNLFLAIFAIGLLYIAVGTFLGIFSDNKYVSALTYPLMLFLVILPLISNPVTDMMNETLDACLFSSTIPVPQLIVLFLAFTILLLFDLHIFKIKIARMKI